MRIYCSNASLVGPEKSIRRLDSTTVVMSPCKYFTCPLLITYTLPGAIAAPVHVLRRDGRRLHQSRPPHPSRSCSCPCTTPGWLLPASWPRTGCWEDTASWRGSCSWCSASGTASFSFKLISSDISSIRITECYNWIIELARFMYGLVM